jgi:hypothetical protein
MKEDTKTQLMALLNITDKDDVDKVIQYSNLIKKPSGRAKANELLDSLISNDLAVARVLNQHTSTIIRKVANAHRIHWAEARQIDISALNKSYVLLVHQLTKIYARNEMLRDIKITPTWSYFDVIEGRESEISEYIYENRNDSGQGHIAQVNKLCIIANKDEPDYTPELKGIIDDADKAIVEYQKQLERLKNERASQESAKRTWFIPEYSVAYKTDGTIIVNDVLRLKKVHVGSAPDRLMEQATAQPNTLFIPELGQTSRNLSTILSSMGFSETLRAIFFPTVSKDKGIVFRPSVTYLDIEAERLDTYNLDTKLKEAGAKSRTKEIEIPF